MYDIIIIGGGAAGMSAALYAGRGGMKTLVIEKLAYGGQTIKTFEIDNYLGISDHPTGQELADRMENHAKKFGASFVKENVKSIENAQYDVKVVRTRKNTYMTKAIIFATGATPKMLGAVGESELAGSGVSYCATCDGAFFKGKDVVVIGGGNTACEDSMYLSTICNKVYMINRSKKFKADATIIDRVRQNGKVTILTDTVVEKFIGDTVLKAVAIRNTASNVTDILNVSGAIVAIGITPETELASSCVELCERGFIKTDVYLKTNVNGIYAAGDVRVSPLKQVITAAADGAVAATSAINYINELGIKSV